VCAEDSEAAKAGYKNICEIGKERIRRAGKKIIDELAAKNTKVAKEVNESTPDLFRYDLSGGDNPVNPVQNSPADIAGALTVQYQAVVAATGQMLREAVKFGAMLMELETIVGKSHGGRGTDGDGIKAWLAEHCPEINYKTATVYKSLAAKSATLIGGMGLQVVAALQGGEKVTKTDGEVIDVPAEIIERRDALFDEVHSRRSLEQAYFSFMAEHGEKPKAKKEPKPLPKLSRQDEAKTIWNGAMLMLSKSSVRDSIPLLDEKATRICCDTLRDLVSLLKEHLKEF
jgi:hypothetical protein